MNRSAIVLLSLFCFGSLAILSYATVNSLEFAKTIQKTDSSEKDSMKVEILQAENRVLRDEINELRMKPDYNSGYKDAIIHMGGPQFPGTYKDGFDAASRLLINADYSDGYHAAIKQFGYTGSMLIPPIPTKKPEPLGSCPVHTGSK